MPILCFNYFVGDLLMKYLILTCLLAISTTSFANGKIIIDLDLQCVGVGVGNCFIGEEDSIATSRAMKIKEVLSLLAQPCASPFHLQPSSSQMDIVINDEPHKVGLVIDQSKAHVSLALEEEQPFAWVYNNPDDIMSVLSLDENKESLKNLYTCKAYQIQFQADDEERTFELLLEHKSTRKYKITWQDSPNFNATDFNIHIKEVD